MKFKYGESFTVVTNKESTSYSLTGKNTTVNKNGYTYTFTPFPGTESNAPVFSLTIPNDNLVYNLTTNADKSSYIDHFDITYKDGTKGTNLSSISQYKDEETITVYTKSKPVAATYNGSNLSFSKSGNLWKATFATLPTDATLALTFETTISFSIDDYSKFKALKQTNAAGTITDIPLTRSGNYYNASVSGDPLTLYTTHPALDNSLNFTTTMLGDDYCYKYEFTPVANQTLSLQFTSEYTISFDDKSQILAILVTDAFGNTTPMTGWDTATSPFTTHFAAGDTYKVYVKNTPASTPSRNFTATTYEGRNCYVTSFNPTADGTQSFTFASTMSTYIDTDELPSGKSISDFVVSYLRYDADNVQVQDLTNSFSQYGSINNHPWVAGDYFEFKCTAMPSKISWIDEDGNIPLTRTEEYIHEVDGNDVTEYYFIYRFSPKDDSRLDIVFDANSSSEPPVVEKTYFSINIAADRENAVVAEIYTAAGELENTVVLSTTQETLTCEEDGVMYFNVTDDSKYAFMTFYNEKEKVDFLDYDAPSTYRVTVRKTRATSDTEMIDNDGDNFTVTTMDKTTLNWYEMSLYIDNSDNVLVEVGPSYEAKSKANREITNIRSGRQTLRFNELETYVVVSSKGLTGIYDVSCVDGNNQAVTVGKTEGIAPVYSVPVSSATDGGTITITADRPLVEGSKTFTLTVDHPELVKTIKRFVSATESHEISLANVEYEGNTYTLTYNDGDYYRVWLSNDYEPESVQQNYAPIDPWYGIYEFYPANGNVTITFGEIAALPTFTVVTDRPAQVLSLRNDTRGTSHLVEQEYTIVDFRAGDECYINLGSGTPKEVSFNDVEIEKNQYSQYRFTPTAGGTLRILYGNDAPVAKFTLTVDDASRISAIYDSEDGEFTDFVDGDNLIPVWSGELYLEADEPYIISINGTPIEDIEEAYDEDWGGYRLEVAVNDVVLVQYAREFDFTESLVLVPSNISMKNGQHIIVKFPATEFETVSVNRDCKESITLKRGGEVPMTYAPADVTEDNINTVTSSYFFRPNNEIYDDVLVGDWTLTIPAHFFSYTEGEDVYFNTEYTYTITIKNGELLDAVTYDATEDYEPEANEKVVYKRTIKETSAGCWQAWFVPFDVTVNEFSKYVSDDNVISFVGMTEVNGEKVAEFKLMSGVDVLEHNTPYLYIPNETGDITYEFSSRTIHAAPEEEVVISPTGSDWEMVGNYVTHMMGENEYALSGGRFLRPNGDKVVPLKPFRAYLRPKVATQQQRVNIRVKQQGTSEIDDIATDVEIDGAVMYDLQGRKVTNPSAGIYILNGQKIVIRK